MNLAQFKFASAINDRTAGDEDSIACVAAKKFSAAF
jgi:hypothetical protein